MTALWNAMLPGIQAALASKGILIGQYDTAQADETEMVVETPSLGDRAKSVTDRVGSIFKRNAQE